MNRPTILGMGVSTIDYLCVLDHFPNPDEKVRAINFQLEGGGNTANTLVALARLGCQAKILSRVGRDVFGMQCMDLFKKEGVDIRLLQVDEVPTPFSIILVDTSQNTRTVIHCSKPATIHYTFHPHHLDNVDLLYADGRNIDAYATLITAASQRNIKIAIEAERKNLSSSQYFSLANVVFATPQFHREYFGNEAYETNLDAILSMGPDIAITTLGSEGVIVKTKEEMIRKKAPLIQPVDTTGAGDAFNAAFLYGLLHHDSLQETALFATRYAAESCKKLGPREGLPSQGPARSIRLSTKVGRLKRPANKSLRNRRLVPDAF
jgi:sugar/nucleoside kinase (ribokinase family)